MRPMRGRQRIALGPLDGAIVSIKDLFDVAGEPTRAGSVHAGGGAGRGGCPVVGRLRAAGAVIVAKTNMTDSPFRASASIRISARPAIRRPARVPGGSSSGARVASPRACANRHRHRYRRFGPHPGFATRPRRLQAEQAARSDRGRIPAVLHARFHWADRERRRLRLADAVMAGEEGRARARLPRGPDGSRSSRDFPGRHGAREGRGGFRGEPGGGRLQAAGVRITAAGATGDLVAAMRSRSWPRGRSSPVEAAEIHAAHLERHRRGIRPPGARGRILQGLAVSGPRATLPLSGAARGG